MSSLAKILAKKDDRLKPHYASLPMETYTQPTGNAENANVAAFMPKFLFSSFPFPNGAITASKVVNEAQNLRQNNKKKYVDKLSSAAGHWLLKECGGDDENDSCGSVWHEKLELMAHKTSDV